MALILLRHTRPDIGDGICYGQTDLHLAQSFEAERVAVAARLPRYNRIVTSPLRRCQDLAEYLSALSGLAVEQDPRVAEMDFGTWEGRAWSDIAHRELDAWVGDFLHARPHGGESVSMFRMRVQRALEDISDGAIPALIVTHAGVVRAASSTGDTANDFAVQIDFGHFVILPIIKGNRS